MFGSSNPFGQSSMSPFGSTNPFGAQTGGSLFSGTATGVFGAAQSTSSLGSTSVFGASASPGFGTSSPAFGASSTPAFGSSSIFGQKPAFGGFGSNTTQSSPFGSTFQQSQPAFGSNLFGSSTPFGATSTPAFGATSTPAFGATSTPAFGMTSTPAFGTTSTPAFGATSTPAFGAASTPAFGSSSPAFGASSSPVFGSTTPAFGASNTSVFGASSTPAFGASSTPAFGGSSTPAFGVSNTLAFGASSTPAFGASSTPAFGASSTPAFGATSTPAFGISSTPAFGISSTPAFGASSTPAFGASSTPSFSFGSSPAFGQSTSTFGSSPFGTTSSPFGAQTSPFGSTPTTPTFGSSGFGQSTFGGQRGGSRVSPFSPTAETDGGTGAAASGRLESISAMAVYRDKSHEELRWEDYQLGDKGGPTPVSQTAAGAGSFAAASPQSNPFATSSAFGQSSANPFSSSTTSNPFAPKTPTFGSAHFGPSSSSPAFGSSPFGTSSTSNPFGSTSSTTPSLFGSTSAFGVTTSSPFGASSTSAFGSTSIFGSTAAQVSTPAFGSGLSFVSSQSSPLFQSSLPSIGQTNSLFGQTGSSFGQSTSAFGPSSLFSTPSTGFASNLFSSSQPLTSSPLGFGQTTPSLTTPFQPAQPSQPTNAFGFSNFGQTQAAGTSNFGSGMPGIFGQSTFGQLTATQSPVVVQPAPITNPFGTLPAMPQMSIGNAGTAPSIQYGISSLPVVDKPAPVRISPLITSRHLSQRRIRLPARKYHPKLDAPKVPFFIDDEETPNTPKADALFIPRENPRALVVRPFDEQWSSRANIEKTSPAKGASTLTNEEGKVSVVASRSLQNGSGAVDKGKGAVENGLVGGQGPIKLDDKSNGLHDDHPIQKEITLSGHRAGEAAIVYEHGPDIEALMPKLRHSDYYTEPRIQELAAKERAEPGFCRHVKDFIVGRHGFGSIKFFGETDVRRLDLESLVQFNHREVIVYRDDVNKPPVGQGLNKPAEVTLLDIKCYEKKTGKHCTEGPRIEKYKEMLKRKAEEQGAEFLSYDPVKGEWKFKVSHFSLYALGSEDDWAATTYAARS